MPLMTRALFREVWRGWLNEFAAECIKAQNMTEYELRELRHNARFWQAVHAGMRITWLNIPGDHYPSFYWSGCLRGERIVECTYDDLIALPLLNAVH